MSTTNDKDIMAIYEIMIATEHKANNETADTDDDQEYYSISDNTEEDSESANEDTDTDDEFWEEPKNPIRLQFEPDVYSLPKTLPESINRFKMLEVIPL